MGRFFTREEDDFLRRNYKKIPAKRMARMLGRTEGTARQRMLLLGLKVPPDIIEKFKRDSQFKKGRISANKGKKMSAEMKRRIAHTFFPKGNIPVNVKWDGHERISKDGYVEVRVRMGKYALKHRLIWEKAHGKIPPGHIIIFKDGNSQNLSLDNLQMISREENMLRNSIRRFPAELQDTIKLVHKLNRNINAKK